MRSDYRLRTGISWVFHRQLTVPTREQIRPEKREVTGSSPIPTTGKGPGQVIHHFDRGFSPEVTATSTLRAWELAGPSVTEAERPTASVSTLDGCARSFAAEEPQH